MSLDASRFKDSIKSKITAKVGSSGSKMDNFCMAIANPTILYLIGKPFTTVDVGMITGPGAGTGTGIMGITVPFVSDAIFVAACASFGTSGGPQLRNFSDGLAEAFVEELQQTSLISVHAPCFTGSGTITIGSIVVVESALAALITAEGMSQGMMGAQWSNFANAIAKGFAQGILTQGTGNVTISGSPVVPPPPSPGGGVGSGTIS